MGAGIAGHERPAARCGAGRFHDAGALAGPGVAPRRRAEIPPPRRRRGESCGSTGRRDCPLAYHQRPAPETMNMSDGDSRLAQVAVHRLAADAELLGKRGLPLTGGGALAQLLGLLGGEGGLAAGVHAALPGCSDTLPLAFEDQCALELGEGAL